MTMGLSLSAQWTSNTTLNTLVAGCPTEDVKSMTTPDGRTWVAFWNPVSSPQNYEMRVQLLDQNGVPQLGTNGLLVNGTVPMSTYTVTWDMAVDAWNNVLLGFTGTGGNTPAMVHKISPAGLQLFGTSGVNLGTGYDVKLLPLSSGETVVGYLPALIGQLQKLSIAGVPAWSNPIVINPTVTGHKTNIGELVELASGKFMLLYHDRTGFSPSGLPFAQKFNTAGLAIWPSAVALTNGVYTSTFTRYDFLADADTVYFGFSGAAGMNIQSYLQRINPNGTLPWTTSGVDFATQSTQLERATNIAIETDGRGVWAVAEWTSSSQSNQGTYVQQYHKKTGAKLLGANAKVVFAVGSADRAPYGALRLLNNQPHFLISDGNSNGVFSKPLLLVGLDTLGNFLFPTQTLPVGTNSTGIKWRFDLGNIVNNAVIATWSENRSGTIRPYAQRVDLTPCVSPIASIAQIGGQNLTATFLNSSLQGDSTFWSFGDGSTVSDTNAIVSHTYLIPGNYTVCARVFSSCSSDTLCISAVVCAGVNSQFTYAQYIDSVQFTGPSSPVDSSFWKFGDGGTLGTTVAWASHVYAANGVYTVTLKTMNACASDSSTQQVIIAGIGLLEGEFRASFLSPNPVQSFTKWVGISSENRRDVRVMDPFGAVIQIPVESDGTLDMRFLPVGLYLVFLQTPEGEMVVRKAIKSL